MQAKVTIVIPVWNGANWLPDCLHALRQQTFRDFTVLIVDNGSNDGSADITRAIWPQAQIIAFKRNRGFAAAVNAGFRASASAYIALLNVDTQPRPNWLATLVATMDQSAPAIGCLASKMLAMHNPELADNCGDMLSWQGAAHKRGHNQPADCFNRTEEVFSACAGAALYRRKMLEELGGFDERFFIYLEDVDLGLRARLHGYHCLFIPTAEVLHKGHGSKIPQGRYVRLITRNRLMLFLKNMPAGLLLRHAPELLYGQLYFLIAWRRPFSVLAGYAMLLPCLAHIIRARRRAAHNMLISRQAVEQLLSPTMPEPTLRRLALMWWQRLTS